MASADDYIAPVIEISTPVTVLEMTTFITALLEMGITRKSNV